MHGRNRVGVSCEMSVAEAVGASWAEGWPRALKAESTDTPGG